MIGARLGNWIVDKELGRGGMGRVYLAHRVPDAVTDPSFGDLAAVKVLSADLAQETGFQQRFQREIDALSQLDHPNIVRFYESGVENGQYFYAMEFINGRDLDEILQERGRLPWKEVLDAALQICPALKHAHDRGIIHRDLKPQNILRTLDGTVKLADFGVAKVFAGRHLTATGGLVGTAEFISPEQAAGKPVTARSDLYALGIVLYTLLTGRVPFEGETIVDIMHKHCYAQPERPQRYVPDLPHEIEELVLQLLQKDPAERPANAQVLMRQLDSLRRKLERKERATLDTFHSAKTRIDKDKEQSAAGPGPATMASQLVREELERQNAAGPIGQIFNRAWVLLLLLALCIGIIIWGFWPPSAEYLFMHGAALMDKSDDVSDWETAWDRYFVPLNQKYPDHPYAEKVEAYHQRLEDRKAELKTAHSTRSVGSSEAQRFYLQGQRLSREGDVLTALRTWQSLVDAFDHVESEQRWVRLAEKGIKELQNRLPAADQRLAAVREALQQAKRQPKDEAERTYRAIKFLYQNDPAAEPILRELAKERTGR